MVLCLTYVIVISKIGEVFTGANTGFKLFYGFVLAIAILGGIGAVIIAFCTVVKARLLIYCACTFLLLLGVVSFILLMAFGILLPNVAQICSYVDSKLSTGQGTV